MRKAHSGIFLISILWGCLLNGQQKASFQNAECLACHGYEANINEKYRINEKNLLVSAHAALSCTDCHAIQPEGPEAEIPHRKNIPDVNCTASCHREGHKPKPGLDPLSYPDSVHGRAYLERGIHKLIFGKYKESIHGRQALAGNADAPL